MPGGTPELLRHFQVTDTVGWTSRMGGSVHNNLWSNSGFSPTLKTIPWLLDAFKNNPSFPALPSLLFYTLLAVQCFPLNGVLPVVQLWHLRISSSCSLEHSWLTGQLRQNHPDHLMSFSGHQTNARVNCPLTSSVLSEWHNLTCFLGFPTGL